MGLSNRLPVSSEPAVSDNNGVQRGRLKSQAIARTGLLKCRMLSAAYRVGLGQAHGLVCDGPEKLGDGGVDHGAPLSTNTDTDDIRHSGGRQPAGRLPRASEHNVQLRSPAILVHDTFYG